MKRASSHGSWGGVLRVSFVFGCPNERLSHTFLQREGKVVVHTSFRVCFWPVFCRTVGWALATLLFHGRGVHA